MVGIVIVSHSAKIADGTKELALQVAKQNQPIQAVGGISTGEMGTEPMRIKMAIELANEGQGVVVLADLGSAILNVDLACELLPDDVAKQVVLADAPLVEGTIGAVVEAALGSELQKVVKTAEAAKTIQKM